MVEDKEPILVADKFLYYEADACVQQLNMLDEEDLVEILKRMRA